MLSQSLVPKFFSASAVPLEPQIFERRTFFPHTPALLWEIETGYVRTLTFHSDGSLIPMGIWQPGDIVGPPLFGSSPCHIECLEEVSAYPRPLSQFDDLYPLMVSHLQQMQDLLKIRHGSVEQRLTLLLQWLAQRFGTATDTGLLIGVRLTQQDLADMMGTTRVTVTRLLQRFEQSGMISRLGQSSLVWHCPIEVSEP